jgi:hypothetical protein
METEPPKFDAFAAIAATQMFIYSRMSQRLLKFCEDEHLDRGLVFGVYVRCGNDDDATIAKCKVLIAPGHLTMPNRRAL